MSQRFSEHERVWFVRVAGVQRGPFSGLKVRNMLLAGEVGLEDGISDDGNHWRKLRTIPEVVPLQMRAGLGDRAAQALLHDRRLRDRQTAERLYSRFPLQSLMTTLLIIAAVLALSIWKGLPGAHDEPRCHDAPAPGVNWRNCILPGLDAGAASLVGANLNSAVLRGAKLTATDLSTGDLRYTDLRRADLSYALLNQAAMVGVNLQGADLTAADLAGSDLRFADLRGSRLHGANLSGARLGDAIWVDDEVCASDSVGECRH